MKTFSDFKDFGKKIQKKFVLRPILLIALSFFIVIVIGSILLYMPFSLQEGVEISYINALFTATTATCVTGLVDLPLGIGNTFSIAGQIIILLLIQLGGLGVTVVGTLFVVLILGKVTLGQQMLIKETWNLSSAKVVKKVFFYTLLITLIVEILGAVLSFISFYCIHEMEVGTAVKNAFFHSISSFNNAGIDLLGTTSLISTNDPLLLTVTSFLIIVGGLGYIVIVNIVSKKFNLKKLSLHSKIVLVMTSVLIVTGAGLIFLTSYSDGVFMISFENSVFLSVSSRTAGFTTVDLSTVPSATNIVLIFLMFIGASPGGTGGGVKTTTIFVIISYIVSIFKNKQPCAFKRQIGQDNVKKALLIFIISFSFILIASLSITIIEDFVGNPLSYESVLFESTSAFATVGLTTGITTSLSVGSRVILIIMMYLGRLGPMSIASILKSNNIQTWHYVEENVPIG